MVLTVSPGVGPDELLVFSTWGARMIALIGRLPATLEDRAIVLLMRRRAPDEIVERIGRDSLQRRLDPPPHRPLDRRPPVGATGRGSRGSRRTH